MNQIRTWLSAIGAMGLFMLSSCTWDNSDPTICTNFSLTYVEDIQPIMARSCAVPDCHVSGFAAGDFESFEGVIEKVDDGGIRQWVVLDPQMPPPNSGVAQLTETEVQIFECWIQNGARRN